MRRSLLLISTLALTLGLAAGPASAALPKLGTFARSVDLRDVPGTTAYRDGHAVPLRAKRPHWFNRELKHRVRRARGRPVAAPPDVPVPSEVGIRPGSWEISPYGCTMNFVFRKAGDLGIGTAGHCVDKIGQHVTLLTVAPGSSNAVLVDLGQVVARHEHGVGDDFALVAIRPRLYSWVSPTIAVIAGPCGGYYGSGPETVAHYGHGLAIGTGGTPRVGLALTWTKNAFGWDGEAIFGDSGSPVRVTNLRAAGDLTHLVVDPRWLPSFIAGTRIGKILQIANGWALVNSSLCL